jgi:hypothetical protein
LPSCSIHQFHLGNQQTLARCSDFHVLLMQSWL